LDFVGQCQPQLCWDFHDLRAAVQSAVEQLQSKPELFLFWQRLEPIELQLIPFVEGERVSEE
jgi:hypothetical protein